MTKPRAKTIQARFGFKDDDLKKSDHDTIMFWLNTHASEFAKMILQVNDSEWQRQAMVCLKSKDTYIKSIDSLPLTPPIKGPTQIIWEKPIKNNNYIIGFIDMVVSAQVPSLGITHGEWFIAYTKEEVFFEIKTSIPSLGELIRQIRMYQEYTRGQFVIVSPDIRFKPALESQGILFYKYTGDPLDTLML